MFDYALVVAPFWIGAVYLAAISVFPNSRPFIFFLFLIVLPESHFGTTWLFFFARGNRRWVWERRGRLVYLPLVMTGAYVLIGATNLEAAILIGGLASGVHVTRQSIGIYRLYGASGEMPTSERSTVPRSASSVSGLPAFVCPSCHSLRH